MAFVGVFVEDTEANARKFLKAHPVSFPYGADWQLTLARPLGFRGMPYTVVMSPQGDVARRFFGPVEEADLVAAIQELLAAPK